MKEKYIKHRLGDIDYVHLKRSEKHDPAHPIDKSVIDLGEALKRLGFNNARLAIIERRQE